VIAEEWLACLLRTYPAQSAGFLAREQDPFRNPAGYAFRQAIGILSDELLHDMDSSRVRAALDSIVQIRAVEGCPPSQALAFLLQLKPILRLQEPGLPLDLLYSRIDEMLLEAFDLFMQYRERTFVVRANEQRRRVHVMERL